MTRINSYIHTRHTHKNTICTITFAVMHTSEKSSEWTKAKWIEWNSYKKRRRTHTLTCTLIKRENPFNRNKRRQSKYTVFNTVSNFTHTHTLTYNNRPPYQREFHCMPIFFYRTDTANTECIGLKSLRSKGIHRIYVNLDKIIIGNCRCNKKNCVYDRIHQNHITTDGQFFAK